MNAQAPTTKVPTEDGFTIISTQVGDTVYVTNSRTGKYKHIMHRVDRIESGVPVTRCSIWARGGTIAPLETDSAIWCGYGCKPVLEPAIQHSDTRPKFEYMALDVAMRIQNAHNNSGHQPVQVTVQSNVITVTYPSGYVLTLTATGDQS